MLLRFNNKLFRSAAERDETRDRDAAVSDGGD